MHTLFFSWVGNKQELYIPKLPIQEGDVSDLQGTPCRKLLSEWELQVLRWTTLDGWLERKERKGVQGLFAELRSFFKDWDNPKENLAQPPAPSPLFHSEKFDSLCAAAAHAALLQPLLTLFPLLYCQPSFFSCHSLSPASADPLHLATPPSSVCFSLSCFLILWMHCGASLMCLCQGW